MKSSQSSGCLFSGHADGEKEISVEFRLIQSVWQRHSCASLLCALRLFSSLIPSSLRTFTFLHLCIHVCAHYLQTPAAVIDSSGVWLTGVGGLMWIDLGCRSFWPHTLIHSHVCLLQNGLVLFFNEAHLNLYGQFQKTLKINPNKQKNLSAFVKQMLKSIICVVWIFVFWAAGDIFFYTFNRWSKMK